MNNIMSGPEAALGGLQIVVSVSRSLAREIEITTCWNSPFQLIPCLFGERIYSSPPPETMIEAKSEVLIICSV